MSLMQADLPARSVEALDPVISRAWVRVLGTSPDPDRPIMGSMTAELGADRSIQLHRFLAEINAATGLDLPLTIIFQAPTLRALTAVVSQRSWAPFERPMQIRPGAGAPLYLLPGVGGLGLDMVDFLDSLRVSSPIYMGHPRGLDGAEPPLTDINAIVEDQTGLLRSVQPRGPYRLLGYSWGGVVALEMARRLKAEGETIAFLGAIEPELNESDWPFSVWLEYSARRVGTHLAKMRNLSPSRSAIYALGRLKPLAGRFARMLGVERPFGWSPYDHNGLEGLVHTMWHAEVRAGNGYRLQYLDEKIHLFASRRGHAALCDPRKVWPRLVRELDLHWSEGDHSGMMRLPQVGVLAEQIAACLDRAGG